MIRLSFYLIIVFVFGFFFGAGLVRHEIIPPIPPSIIYDNFPWMKNKLDIPIVNEKILINSNQVK